MIINAEGKTSNGVQLFDAETNVLRVLDSSPSIYTDLSWRKDSADLATLRAKTNERKEGSTYAVLAWTGLGQSERQRTYDPTADSTFPTGMRTVSFRRLSWSDDGAELVRSLALVAERTTASGTPLKRPRIGLYQPWSGSMDEGWTRWLLEQYGFEFLSVHPEDFRSPLRDKVDVLILAEDARIPVEGGETQGPGGRGAGTPPGGGRASGAGRVARPEYAYTLSQGDLQGFEAFVRSGGTVVCFNSATRFAIQQFKLPVKNVVEGLKPEEFFVRGSIIEVKVDRTHPVMAGMPERAAVFVDGSPVFEMLEGFKGTVLARYQESSSPLLSGYLIGEKYLQGKAAALDVEVDEGRVVLLGFRPQWRAQSFGTFRVVFNAAISGSSGTPAP